MVDSSKNYNTYVPRVRLLWRRSQSGVRIRAAASSKCFAVEFVNPAWRYSCIQNWPRDPSNFLNLVGAKFLPLSPGVLQGFFFFFFAPWGSHRTPPPNKIMIGHWYGRGWISERAKSEGWVISRDVPIMLLCLIHLMMQWSANQSELSIRKEMSFNIPPPSLFAIILFEFLIRPCLYCIQQKISPVFQVRALKLPAC